MVGYLLGDYFGLCHQKKTDSIPSIPSLSPATAVPPSFLSSMPTVDLTSHSTPESSRHRQNLPPHLAMDPLQ